MPQFKQIEEVPMPVAESFKFSTNIYNICQMLPRYIKVKVLEGSDSLKSGDSVKLNVSIFGINFTWESVMDDYEENAYFSDRMLKGPFKSWEHKHYFKESGQNTIQTDIINYELPLGTVGRIADKLFVRKIMKDIFVLRYNFKQKCNI